MQGVTTAIVVFIFVCIGFPKMVKNQPQFYAALAMVLLIILIDCIGVAFGTAGGALLRLAYFFNALLQVGAILLLVLSAGGQTFKELSGEMAKSIDAIRGGEPDNSVIPLTGERPKPRTTPRPPPRKPADQSSIPLD